MAMAASSSAKSLEDGLSCSLCHKYFTEPVSIDCGHSFCRACIAQHWEEWETNISCPQCGERSLKRKLRPNKDLENIVQIAKRIKLETTDGVGGERMCEMHQEPLKFFCKDKQKLVCGFDCIESKDHVTHVLVVAEEAAENYKKELETQLQAWREKREKALHFHIEEENKYKEFLEMVDIEKQKIVFTFEETQHFLKQQEKSMLAQLDKLVKEEEEFVTKLSGEICLMDTFIHDIEEKSRQPVNTFMQNIGETLSRCKVWPFQQLDVCSELEKKLHAFSKKYIILQETLRVFREDLPQQLEVKWVNVTLDPDTAHPQLTVSDDQKNLTWTKNQHSLIDNPERFSSAFCVLGCERFISGRLYWEVKVGERGNWAVGVARDSVNRKEPMTIRNLQKGIWAVSKKQSGNLAAGSLKLEKAVPKTVGVYLDLESHRVVIFDADKGNALCTFCSASFKTEKIRPFFWLQKPYGSPKEIWIKLCSWEHEVKVQYCQLA